MFRNKQPNIADATRFSRAPLAEVEHSRMTSVSTHLTTMNAGDIVPIKAFEVLPHSTFSVDFQDVIRQTTLLRPVMGEVEIMLAAFFVPNRIINESWKNVQGENTAGAWAAPEVDLAPLYVRDTNVSSSADSVQIPVGSVADYYGFPTQLPIHYSVLEQCNDLLFRGYIDIYNNYYRDQNYQPPLAYSKLNVYQGFLQNVGTSVYMGGNSGTQANYIGSTQSADGSYPKGAIVKALYGEGATTSGSTTFLLHRLTNFSALAAPLKANKLHDYFTSVLPSPQKGPEVYFGLGDVANVTMNTQSTAVPFASGIPLNLSGGALNSANLPGFFNLLVKTASINNNDNRVVMNNADASSEIGSTSSGTNTNYVSIDRTNLVGIADLSTATGVSINDLRTAIATQQVYETLARGGSRYVEMLNSFFGIETENPFPDLPVLLGKYRHNLDTYQVAQTSATSTDSPQGSLAAFGYTDNGGHLFTYTAREHGYIHILATIRQKNVYTSYLSPDKFRRTTMDFYLPQLANISEQPVRLALLNPFRADSMELAIGYQEAWAEYRMDPSTVSGFFRSGIDGSLDSWTLADTFDSNFQVVTGEWLKSNAQQVVDRTVAITSALAPQFKAQFVFKLDKELPMPTYSIPGLDTI